MRKKLFNTLHGELIVYRTRHAKITALSFLAQKQAAVSGYDGITTARRPSRPRSVDAPLPAID